MKKTVLVIGTLDTKGVEFAFLRRRLDDAGVATLVIDVGIIGPPRLEPDIDAAAVAAAGGADLAALVAERDRGKAIAAMARGAAATSLRLLGEGRLDGIIGMGGGGGTAIATAAMRALPVGIPKLMISTLASGDTRPFVDVKDIMMMPAIVDVAGVNRLSARIIANAAAAMAGMVSAAPVEIAAEKPLVAATMFGVTTPCVNKAREVLEKAGYEVLVFHATGIGGRIMEELVRGGFIAGVLDITTTELADELAGGILSAGPDRLEAAGAAGVPQVVSAGALDMVNFGPRDTVPARYADRLFYQHTPQATLMRTTAEENARLGSLIAAKLNRANGPVTFLWPARGVSMIDMPGKPFHDPAADAAFLFALKAGLAANVRLVEMDTDINDDAFAARAAELLIASMRSR